jgi:hypothetical protein
MEAGSNGKARLSFQVLGSVRQQHRGTSPGWGPGVGWLCIDDNPYIGMPVQRPKWRAGGRARRHGRNPTHGRRQPNRQCVLASRIAIIGLHIRTCTERRPALTGCAALHDKAVPRMAQLLEACMATAGRSRKRGPDGS